ncbi:alcohol dehydrogenase catalytic domain-containing protein, partial [Streptomyces reticuliscabiei]|uniref:alcohol dehydrogenase catalytic domain-containing protein n=1 Tax=Streptomyces reticuliscabiei TaxID=146821 RepID=UPI000D1B8C85
MRAVVFERYGEPAEVREVPDPVPAPHGVVVRVEATGLCRSDWHGWMGHDPDIALPHVPGHELAGVVEAVGAGVTGWRAGDRVTVPFVCACGSCPSCMAGDQQVCERQTQPGFTHWGSFAEFVALDHGPVGRREPPAHRGRCPVGPPPGHGDEGHVGVVSCHELRERTPLREPRL